MLRPLRAYARHVLVRSAAAGLGLAVSAALFAAGPAGATAPVLSRVGTADAGILGLPDATSVFPQIQGLGTISGTYAGSAYYCTNSAQTTGTFTCLTALGAGLTGGSLTASPLPGYQFDSWTNCPSGSTDPTCNLGPVSGLLAAPLAQFSPLSDTPLAPDTIVTGGPKNNGWLLATATKFGLSSSSPLPATFTCTLDGKALEGCQDAVAVSRLGQRTHVFTAAASTLGVADASPETRVFTVPVNNTRLKSSTGWAKRTAKGHFLNTFSQTKRHGATLKVRRSAIKSVALVVSKGRGYGTVNVYLGKTLLKKVSLGANRSVGKRVVPIKQFSSKKRGTITVKVVSRGKLVRIEGLGISSR